MAFKNLNLGANIWLNAGLNYLYFPLGMPKFVKKNYPAPSEYRAPKPAYASTPDFNRLDPANKKSESLPEPHSQEIPGVELSPLWLELLAKCKKGNVAWTYLELGLDLLPENMIQNPEELSRKKVRKEIIKKFLTELKYPVGTITFCPLMPGPFDAAQFDGNSFWTAIQYLGCRAVTIFGSGAGKILLPAKKLQANTFHQYQGKFIWLVRDLNIMAEKPELWQSVFTFVKKSLNRFAFSR